MAGAALPAALGAYIDIATRPFMNPLLDYGEKGVDAYVQVVEALLDREGLDARALFIAALGEAAGRPGVGGAQSAAIRSALPRFKRLGAGDEKHRRDMIAYGSMLSLAGALVDHTYSRPRTVGEFRAMEASRAHGREMRGLVERVRQLSAGVYGE